MTNVPFKPAWWLPGPHLQTLWPKLARRLRNNEPINRERIELPDGDFVDLDWVGGDRGPIVLILHGLEGSVESNYARGMLNSIARQGWRGAVMHFRGCSGELNRLSRMYHSGETQDLATVVNFLKAREPSTRMAAIGFSLGGNVLLKWLGETQEHNPLSAAIGVSVPFELHKSAYRVQRGFSRIYQWYLLRSLIKKLMSKLEQKTIPFEVPPISQLRTIPEFDDKVTAPLHGFTSANDYYSKSSCRQYLKAIRVPTLLLQSQDDPFMTYDIIPEEHELAASVTLEVSKRGGHVGFVGGRYPWKAEYWLEQRAPLFLKHHLEGNSHVIPEREHC